MPDSWILSARNDYKNDARLVHYSAMLDITIEDDQCVLSLNVSNDDAEEINNHKSRNELLHNDDNDDIDDERWEQQTWIKHDEPHEVRNELFCTNVECGIHVMMIRLQHFLDTNWSLSNPKWRYEEMKWLLNIDVSQSVPFLFFLIEHFLVKKVKVTFLLCLPLLFSLLSLFLSFSTALKIELLQLDNGRVTSCRERGKSNVKKSVPSTAWLYGQGIRERMNIYRSTSMYSCVCGQAHLASRFHLSLDSLLFSSRLSTCPNFND